MYDPNGPEKLAGSVYAIRDKARILKCLAVDDQMALIRELWPQIDDYESGLADLGDIIVHEGDYHVSAEDCGTFDESVR